ncbi:hypothetical protein Glove_411g36 [Diversispora epigaea]|uniref:Uncharacterized protein n=1 Tax=Diversispora epigaea TaxID=1348612 RepID=A0A397GYF7_9GLOM|nr:hypothetical protein Glove_411g36 [Diversispora epigaea]
MIKEIQHSQVLKPTSSTFILVSSSSTDTTFIIISKRVNGIIYFHYEALREIIKNRENSLKNNENNNSNGNDVRIHEMDLHRIKVKF